jgi:uncharacterized membrane protein HdeD (DUF308 family)
MSIMPSPDTGHLEDAPLLDVVANHRSLLLGRGIAAIAFAFLAFFWPKLTVFGLTILWGGYSFADGVLALMAAVRSKASTRVWLALIGMAGLACAAGVLIASEEVAAHLAAIVSTWATVTGAMYVWVALKVRKALQGSWILALDGIGIILFGLALAFWPDPELAALVWLTGCFAALLGGQLLYVGLSIERSR